MNLAFHQLRHEIRRSRIGLSLYALVLLCNLAVALGWIGAPTLQSNGVWDHGGTLSVMILLIAYWIAFGTVVANCVIADSPARRDRFLATRPLPVRSLTGGKLLYIALAAVLPAVLVEVVSLSSAGAGPATILLGGFERFLLCGVLALAIGAFAAHWKSTQAFFLAAVISFAVIMILGRLVFALLLHWLGREFMSPFPGPTFYTILQGVAVLAAGLALTAWVCARRGVLYRYLAPSLLPIAAAGLAVMVASPLRNAAYQRADQPSIDRLLERGTATSHVVSRGFYIQSREDRAELEASFSIAPQTTGFPDDLELRWETQSERWKVDGQVVQEGSRHPRELARLYVGVDAVPVSWALARAIQNHLDTKVVFRLGSHGFSNHSTSLSPRSLSYLPDSPLAGKQARVETNLAGDAFRWSVVADLPLAPAQSAVEGESTWLLASVVPNLHELHVQLSEKTVALRTAAKLSSRKSADPWREHNRFVLYLPDSQLAWFGEAQFVRAVPTVSAATQYIGGIEFRHRDGTDQAGLPPHQLERARLLILRSNYVGRLSERWTSPEFTLQPVPSPRPGQSSTDETLVRWSSADFALWFHRWRKIDPAAGDELVHPHLLELFANLERLDRSLHGIREPAVRYAARFVPRHLEFFIEHLPRVAYPVTTFLVNAIALGAEEPQIPAILAHLADHPALDTVVEMRGWQQVAHPFQVAIVRDGPNSGGRYLNDLLARDDPSLDRFILDSYRANPSTSVYRSLRSIPRLAPEAETITRELWKPGRLVIERGQFKGTLEFGLLQGRPEALEELFILIERLHNKGHDAPWELAQLIANTLHVPKEVRGQHNFDRKFIDWAAAYRPSDFRFDPVFQRFVLKAAHQTI